MLQVHAEYDLNGLTACEQEQIARQIFFPENGYELHVSPRVFFLYYPQFMKAANFFVLYSYSEQKANALKNQLKQIVEQYLLSNNGIQYVNDDDQPNYDSIDMDALGIYLFILYFRFSVLLILL